MTGAEHVGERPRARAGAATDVGRVRDHNEDAALVLDGLYLVADGMGGHAAGEVASGIAVATMGELAGREPLSGDEVTAQVRAANQRILEAVSTHPERRGMGTTLTGLALVTVDEQWRWLVLNVGDSRTYRLADGELTRVTVDHSEVQQLVDAHVITAEQARVHPARNIVTRSLGTHAAHRVDTTELAVRPGETFVVCSDGLTEELTDTEIRDIAIAHPDPQDAASQLVREAVTAGGRDNVTVVVVTTDDAVADAVGR